MKIYGYCNQSIPVDVGTNFIACLYDYYIFPIAICLILIVIFSIVYFKLKKKASKSGEKENE